MLLRRRIDIRIILPALGLLVSILACSRGDVPMTSAVGSGGLPAETTAAPSEEESVLPTLTSAPVVTTTPFEIQPLASPTFPPTATVEATEVVGTLLYESQPGDTLRAVAVRYAVLPEDISSTTPLPVSGSLLDPGQILIIPNRVGNAGPDVKLLPDSEVVFSPHAAEFDVVAFAEEQGGYLTEYREYVGDAWHSGPEVVALAARDNSINPRLLLAFLEQESGWVTDPTAPVGNDFDYPMGEVDPQIPGLYRQLAWLANELGNGYYGWRSGALTDVRLQDGEQVRLAPALNAGTVALQYYFSLTASGYDQWSTLIDMNGFMAQYRSFFGDPWGYEYILFEPGVAQPDLILPFEPNRIWAFTGGPHGAWERESAWAALDFAPASMESGCAESVAWVVASAPGLVVRSTHGAVVLDLDGDGREQTGWTLLYLHIATESRVSVGTYVDVGDRIGHPSCEGGIATGTHVHIARKYNGEWILADGPLPFEMSGWIAHAGSEAYQGALIKDDDIVYASPYATQETLIIR